MNKTYKKILSGVLACTMIASAALPSVTAFAGEATIRSEGSGTPVAVGAQVQGTREVVPSGDTAEDVEKQIITTTGKNSKAFCYGEVEWDHETFIYDFGTVSKYEWDVNDFKYKATEFTYKNGVGPGWDHTTTNIKFTNYSNREVIAGVQFVRDEYLDFLFKDINVNITNPEQHVESAVAKDYYPTAEFQLEIDGEPTEKLKDYANSLFSLGAVVIYMQAPIEEDPYKETPPEADEDNNGDHVHHYVYDQFGRLVCTGCNEVKHEYCIDEDEDGLCDECGMERDFCPDCHIGGKCRCT